MFQSDRDGYRDELDAVISRRGLARFGVSVLASLGLLLTVPTASEAKRNGKRKKKRNTQRRNTGDGGGTTVLVVHRPVGSASLPGEGDDGGRASLDTEEQAFLLLLNDYRAANGRTPLTHHAQLSTAAEAHSHDMATNNFTGHMGADGSNPGQRIERAGYVPARWGENVFWGNPTAPVAFAWWKHSPSHNAAMLNPEFTETGIGRAFNPSAEFGWYWTNTFGSPSTSGAPNGASGPALTLHLPIIQGVSTDS